MPSRWLSTSSRCRSASLTSSATVSAMKATASSGPPSPARSSVGDSVFLPEAVRFRPPAALLNKLASQRHKVLLRNNPFDGATLGRISQLTRYKVDPNGSLTAFADLTGAASPPMFGSNRWAASLAESHLHLFP